MTLKDVIEIAHVEAKPFRRKGWTHADWLKVAGQRDSYGNGVLFWESGERVSLFFVSDLAGIDWHVKGEEP